LAEAEEDPNGRRELLTFVMVGRGSTGVRAGRSALAVLTHYRVDGRLPERLILLPPESC